jgi:hypothetical protein
VVDDAATIASTATVQTLLTANCSQEVPNERTLSKFIAHEIARTLIPDEWGAARYCRHPTWKDVGHSDHVGERGGLLPRTINQTAARRGSRDGT